MLCNYDNANVSELPDLGGMMPDLGDGIGEMGWGLKSIRKGLKKGLKKGVKLAKKTTKTAVKWSPAGISARAALAAAKKAKLGKGLKKVGKFAKSHKLLIAAPAAGVSLWGVKKLGKKMFGPKRPSKISTPDGEVIEPDKIEEETGIPSEAVAEAAMEANKADDEEGRQEAVDAVEERYGLEDDALQPIAEATSEEGGEEESEGGDESDIEGMGWSITGGLKSVGRGIKKGAKATGKGLKVVGKGAGKLAVKGAKIAGKGVIAASKQALTTAAQRYGLISSGGGGDVSSFQKKTKSYLPWIAGGVGLLTVGYLVTRKRKA